MFLDFNYDTDVVKKKATRNAGRKEIFPKEAITLGEVKEMKKSMSNDQIAITLGLSRATFYRKLKAHKKEKILDIFLF